MSEEEQSFIAPEKKPKCSNCESMKTISMVGVFVMFFLCALWIYPELKASADCKNECNEALQTLYNACVIQNGIAPNFTGLPAPVYSVHAELCEYEYPNGTRVEVDCPHTDHYNITIQEINYTRCIYIVNGIEKEGDCPDIEIEEYAWAPFMEVKP